MRIAGLLMGIWLIALNFIPCADDLFTRSSGIPATEFSKMPGQQENGHKDDCSPFCYCTCCAGTSITHSPAAFNYGPVYNAVDYNTYISSTTVEIAYPIWQPPRL